MGSPGFRMRNISPRDPFTSPLSVRGGWVGLLNSELLTERIKEKQK